MNGVPPDSEARAAEALITAALHVWDHEVTPEEVEIYMQKEHALSSEDTAALAALRNSVLHEARPCPDAAAKPLPDSALEEFLILYRKKPKEGFCRETVDEIQRRREELKKLLRSKSNEP